MKKNFINRIKCKIKNLKENDNTKGITMVALVVTLVVLLMITAIAIGTLKNDDGVFNKTAGVNEIYVRERARTKLEVVLNDAVMLKSSPAGLPEYKLDEMLSELGKVNGSEVEIDGYTYTIDREKLEITKIEKIETEE